MQKSTVWTAAAFVAGVVAAVFLGAGRASAAGARPALDVAFGPIQVEGSSRATFFLALRNTGGATATFALGDTIEVRYGTGGGAGDLLAANQTMTVEPLPNGVALQQILDSGGHEIGVRFAMQGAVEIPAGSADVFLLHGATASPGVARMSVGLRLGKGVGKAPKSLAPVVVKTPPATGVDFYGDGGDGALDVTADANLQSLHSYTDVLIRAGTTVTVASGTTIRCTGSFENRGRIVVRAGSSGGGVLVATQNIAQQIYAPFVSIDRGDALTAPSTPGVTNSQPVAGAGGGVGLGTAVYSLPLSHYRHGGGGGSGTLGTIGGDGGGVLRIIARGPIVNGGSIEARGGAPVVNRTGLSGAAGGGAGGGGGGVVILASGTSVDNSAPVTANGPAATGTVDVSGGNGGTADPRGGGGGGGGGGLAVFCAPSVPTNGSINLFGGFSAFQTLNTQETLWAGGGGGGACVGDGGGGSPVSAGGVVGPPVGSQPAAPTPGQLIVRTADPRTLWQ